MHPTLATLLELAEADLALDKHDRHEARLREAIPAAEQALTEAKATLAAAREAVKANGIEQQRLAGVWQPQAELQARLRGEHRVGERDGRTQKRKA